MTTTIKHPSKHTTLAHRNAWFAKLTLREQRLVLAQDVLEQLDARRFQAVSNDYYFRSPTVDLAAPNLQRALHKTNECQVCALGSLFYTKVRNYNAFQLETHWQEGTSLGREPMEAALKGIFSPEQLTLIEDAFESDARGIADPYDKVDADLRDAAVELYHECSDEERLRAIMQNILDNDGTFVVPE